MPFYFFIWSDENIEHIAANGVSQDDFEAIVCNPLSIGSSRSSGHPIAFGYTEDGCKVVCVYKKISDVEILPITAYEVD